MNAVWRFYLKECLHSPFPDSNGKIWSKIILDKWKTDRSWPPWIKWVPEETNP